MSRSYIVELDEAVLDELIKYHFVTSGRRLQQARYKNGNRWSPYIKVQAKVFDPYMPDIMTPIIDKPSTYCTKHSLNHGKKYPSCRVAPSNRQDTK